MEEAQPKALDLRTVMQMFQEIKKDMKKMKTDDYDQPMQVLQENQIKIANKVCNIRGQLDDYKAKNEILNGTVNRMAQVISDPGV